MGEPILIGDARIEPGTRLRLKLPVARLPTETWMSLPIEVVHGQSAGPRLWLSAAVHGDEINGVEIIRQVLEYLDPARLAGTVIAVPIVNVFGFIQQSRYLPDQRDLNRSFPGGPRGSLASRLAHLVMSEVVSQCTHGIDLHTGSHHRANLPQIRANLHDAETRRCAEAFAAPVMMHAETRDGSLRQAATASGIHVLLYEAGEPLRFDPLAIRLGVEGVLRVMAALAMCELPSELAPPRPSTEVFHATWIRARRGGILRLDAQLGDRVEAGQRLGVIADAFGDNSVPVRAPFAGAIIGATSNPLVHPGDGILNLAAEEPGEGKRVNDGMTE
jgi:predicted deacylase